jgi:hypothetical protein
MNKKLVFAALCVVAFGSSIKAELQDSVNSFFSTLGGYANSVVDAPANVVFRDHSWVARKTHYRTALVARLGLTAYVARALSKEDKVKAAWKKLTGCCKKK